MHLYNGLESLFNTFSIGTKHRHSNRSIGHSFYTCIPVHFVHIRWWPWPKIFALQDIEPDFWTCWAQLPPNLMQQRQYRSRIRDEPETFPWKIKDFSIKQNGTQLLRSFKPDNIQLYRFKQKSYHWNITSYWKLSKRRIYMCDSRDGSNPVMLSHPMCLE